MQLNEFVLYLPLNMSLNLTISYQILDLQNENLCPVEIDTKNVNLNNDYLSKEKWFEVCRRINKDNVDFRIENIYFIQNNPLALFVKKFNRNKRENEIINTLWNLARPKYVFLENFGEIVIYDIGNQEDIEKPKPIETVKEVSELLKYHRQHLETDNIFLLSPTKKKAKSADAALINDLKELKKILTGQTKMPLQKKLEKEQVHTLIAQVIFIRYLEDREILDKGYFVKLANENQEWKTLLEQPDNKVFLNPEMGTRFFPRILKNRDFSIALFRQLAIDFNGDVFSKEENYLFIAQEHLNIIRQLLIGNIDYQNKLFLWAYQFDVIPLELISSIYEEFYHQKTDDDDRGTNYTPSSLVDFMLSRVLTTDRLANKPRVLDPACGSGIFIVEAFRRIVRYNRLFNPDFEPNFETLKNILSNQILGIELNKEAAKISAFSLYIAFLDFLDPRNIRYHIDNHEKLPFLLYSDKEKSEHHINIIFDSNSFWVENLFNQDADLGHYKNVDIIVGNPPWGSAKLKDKEDKIAIEWCAKNGFAISDNERSQMFIWRSLAFLKENGIAALLVSSGIFFKGSEASNKFKTAFVNKATVSEIYSFAHTRHIFFNTAISPFMGIVFEKKKPTPQHNIKYWTLRHTKQIDRIKTVILNKTDFKYIPQNWTSTPDIWKIYQFGNQQDFALISGLRLNSTLNDYRLKEKLPFQGYKENDKSVTKKHYEWLKKYKEFPTILFTDRYDKLNSDILREIPELIAYPSNESLFTGSRILLKGGINTGKIGRQPTVRLENSPFAFNSSIICILLEKNNDSDYKFILGLLWSSLARYYYFMTASKFGIWRDEIKPAEIFSFPIAEINEYNLHYRAEIIKIVEKLRDSNQNDLFNLNMEVNDITILESQLNDAVFNLYNLTCTEKNLVKDHCLYTMDFCYKKEDSIAVKPIPNLLVGMVGKLSLLQKADSLSFMEDYIHFYGKMFQPFLKEGRELHYEVVRSKSANWENETWNDLIAVIFTIEDIGTEVKKLQFKEWANVVSAIKESNDYQKINNNIYIDNQIRIINDYYVMIIKRNEQRLWTKTEARTDAEGIFINLNKTKKQEENAKITG